ncbi:MAG: 30S ribosomal protein S13 [Candidatus Micrarchaeia archaeon]
MEDNNEKKSNVENAEKAEKAEKTKPKQEKQAQEKQHHEQKKVEKATSIIRIGGRDVNGELSLVRAIDQIKGIGVSMANAVSYVVERDLKIPRDAKLNTLTEEQIQNLEAIMNDPIKYGIPKYLLNRNKDMETGKDKHLISNDLSFVVRQDINRDINIKAWRGFRHQHGQKVRGQRTRSTGRTGTTIGVVKKTEAAKAAPAAEKGKGAKEAKAPAASEKK